MRISAEREGRTPEAVVVSQLSKEAVTMLRRPRTDTLADRIVYHLGHYPDGATDADLEHALKANHQHVNMVCRRLAERGLLVRRLVGATIRNFLAEQETQVHLSSPKEISRSVEPTPPAIRPLAPEIQPWYWERNVQAAVVRFLIVHGWTIQSMADTAAHEKGKDIVAERDGVLLWVTAKGFPKGTPRTRPNVQARH